MISWRSGLETKAPLSDRLVAQAVAASAPDSANVAEVPGTLTWFGKLAGLRRSLATLWAGSLQTRLVTTTVLLGLITTGLIGSYLRATIADGLATDRLGTAQGQSRELTNLAQGFFDGMRPSSNSADLNAAVSQIVRQQLRSVGADASRYTVFVRAVSNQRAETLDTEIAGLVSLSEIPSGLRNAVSKDPKHLQTAIVTLRRGDAGSSVPGGANRSVPAVVVGSQVTVPTAGAYDLYFVYPMDQEERGLRVITRSMVVGALLLTLVLVAIAALVARQVVAPVRRAAAVAERLSAGSLNERMSVTGSDDLAALGNSFNGMADNLQRQIRRLEGLSRLQQRFVSDVSHELRTPLTTVRMASDVIYEARADFPPSVGRSSELMQDELDRFEDLLADLLEISRIDAGVAVLDPTETDLSRLCVQVVRAAAPIAQRRGSQVELNLPPEPVRAVVDARRIERVLRNLVVNAIEHSDGKPVQVQVAAGPDAVAALVIDHGVGLRAGEAAMVFNRFWRADPARARTTGGTGLGLAISLEDARLHDGWLQAWGEPGEGSRFRLTLPREPGLQITASPLPLTPGESTPHVEPVP